MNHYHLVLHVDKAVAKKADMRDIVERWHRRFAGVEASRKYMAYEPLEPHEKDQLSALVEIWRTRLFDISWMMRTLNETTARKANHEDECTGRFWEGRFNSQSLLYLYQVFSAGSHDYDPGRRGLVVRARSSAGIPRCKIVRVFSEMS